MPRRPNKTGKDIMSDSHRFEVDRRGVATLTLARPDVRNAFDQDLIDGLAERLMEVRERDDIRLLVLTGAGKCFSAGADINWMRSMVDASEEDNLEDALRLADLMGGLHDMGKPTVARVNGHAFGDGVGLVACCDIAVAAKDALFSFSEVRLGLVPAVISPYVLDAIGVRHARRYFLSGEVMSAKQARRIGLVHEVVKRERLDDAVERQVSMLLLGGPAAIRECKALIAMVDGHALSADQALRRRTAEVIAQLRVTEEGQEGLRSFLDKRSPTWVVDEE
jgi:methylglutaconyl-CoA hydratase